MKTINYTGSSKLISRIVNLLNRKTPLPLDGDGDPDWGTNGQFLTTDGVGGTAWSSGGGGGDTVSWTQTQASGTKIAEIDINGTSQNVYVPTAPTVNDGTLTIQQNGTTVGTFSANQSGNTTVNLTGGGSGGHTIENTSGTDLPQEDNLQFVGVYTRDDSVNSRTEVNIVRQMTKAAMETLSSAEKEGFIDTTDEDDDYIPIAAEDVKRGVSDVDADLTALENGKVNRSGDTMTGNLTVDRKNGTASVEGYSYFTLGNATPAGTNQNSTGIINLYSETAYPAVVYANALTQIRYIGFPNKSGTLSMRTVTILVNETANISAGGNKTYATLTASFLSAYDEIWIYAEYGNTASTGSATKAQIAAAASYSSGGVTGATIQFFGYALELSGTMSITQAFGIKPRSTGLQVFNNSVSSTIGKLLIEGITY